MSATWSTVFFVSYEHLDSAPGFKALAQDTTIMLSQAGSFYNHWGMAVLPDDVKIKKFGSTRPTEEVGRL